MMKKVLALRDDLNHNSAIRTKESKMSHIEQPYTLSEIKAKIASHDYNAEHLLQHAMLLLEPAAVAPQGEYPHEQMDAMALARYKVTPSHASMLWSHAVVAGDGAQQLYVGREVECQNMARKFAGAFLDGAFAFHSMAAAPTAQAAPALEAPAAPDCEQLDVVARKKLGVLLNAFGEAQWQAGRGVPCPSIEDAFEAVISAAVDLLAAAPQAPAAPAVDAPAERDAAFEAVRNRLCSLQRYSFVLDDDGIVRRAHDRTGSWIEFDDAHALFDPVAVDAAIAAQAKEGGAA